MHTLLLATIIDGAATESCDYDVAVDGGAFQPASTATPGPAEFQVDDGASFLDIRATPHAPEFWPVQGRFKFQFPGSGDLIPIDAPDSFGPPRSSGSPGAFLIVVDTYLSRLRDASAACLASLAAVPPYRLTSVPGSWPPAAWDTPSVSGIDCLDPTPVAGGALQATSNTIDPAGEDIVFERKGTAVPQLIAVNWPTTAAPYSAAPPTPFLVYFHANMSQNAETYYLGPYPFHFDYVFYGLWNYLNYRESPLTQWPYSLGLPYQVAMSGKPVVTVLPCSHVSKEIGSFRGAADMATTLRDIQGCMFRRAGVYDPPPDLGRVALAGFSGASAFLTAFLNDPANKADPFYAHQLREVYSFDMPDNAVLGLATAITNWRASVTATDTRAAVYRQTDHVALHSYYPLAERPASGPFVTTTGDGSRTLGLIGAGYWRAAAAARGYPTMGYTFEEVHHMFPSTLLADALRRSGF
ncbi:hypothetical protein [Streptomyces sp. NPDC001930]|uniref:hypothetical protein n=1 Tax=Streptomyces sp. NPDC001930 TaxID=3364625 RepID=UPI00368CDC33